MKKRIYTLLLSVLIIMSLASCGNSSDSSSDSSSQIEAKQSEQISSPVETARQPPAQPGQDTPCTSFYWVTYSAPRVYKTVSDERLSRRYCQPFSP